MSIISDGSGRRRMVVSLLLYSIGLVFYVSVATSKMELRVITATYYAAYLLIISGIIWLSNKEIEYRVRNAFIFGAAWSVLSAWIDHFL